MGRYILFLIALVILYSCEIKPKKNRNVNENIKLAGNNGEELSKVLEAYKNTPAKKDAAEFLIGNMSNHYYIEGHKGYNTVFSEAIKYLDENELNKDSLTNIWNNAFDRISHVPMRRRTDLKFISSEFLIENIEMAFKSQEELLETFRPSKNMFLNYVLPYRIESEPLELGLRKFLHKKYSWVYSILRETNSLERTLCVLLDSLNPQLLGRIKYPHYMPISELEKIKFGNCENVVNLLIHILRSLGIACTKDYTIQWGNHLSSGHSWLVVFDGENTIPLDVFDTRLLKKLYEVSSLPKVYRKTFINKPICKDFQIGLDVTHFYKPENEIKLNVNIAKSAVAPLCVFGENGEWNPIGYSTPGNNRITFNNVGTNVIYATFNPKEKNIPVPFYLDRNHKVQTFIPDFDDLISTTILTRKWQPYKARHPFKLEWIYSIDGCEIYGANRKDYSDAQLLTKVKSYNSRQQLITVQNKNKYRHYILKPSDAIKKSIHLSGFHLLDEEKKVVKTDFTVSMSGIVLDGNKTRNVIDTEPLTYLAGKNLMVVYHFQEPRKIKYFSIQPRNDDNNIRINDKYELMYWNEGWVSAGQKVAKTDSLLYNQIPSKTVYWLKNLSRGKEEHLFFLDKNGQQQWPISTFDPIRFYNEFPNFQEQLCDIDSEYIW